MGICFERRADYVILIVYPHLNFNLPFSLFFASSERRKNSSRAFILFVVILTRNLENFCQARHFSNRFDNWTQSCSTVPDTIITAHMLFAVWSPLKSYKKMKENPVKMFLRRQQTRALRRATKNAEECDDDDDGVWWVWDELFHMRATHELWKMSVEIPLRQNRRSTLFVALAFDKINRFNVRISTPQLRTCLGKSRAVLKNL